MSKPSIRRNVGHHNANEGSYLSSVSDLMSGLLFIFILALMIFMINANKKAQEAELVTQELEKTQVKLEQIQQRLINNYQARRLLLQRISVAAKNEVNIVLDIDIDRGILRIPESAISFETGSAEVNQMNKKRLKQIGDILSKEVVCFVSNSQQFNLPECKKINPYKNQLDAVFIEGHTDNQAYVGDTTGALNRKLSTARSNTIYLYLVQKNDQLNKLRNLLGEKLFSISGYGSERPLPGHEHNIPTNDPANRRIELRFIFAEPKMTSKEEMLLNNKR